MASRKPYDLTRSDTGARQSYQVRIDGRLVGRITLWHPFGWLASGCDDSFDSKEAAAEAVYETARLQAAN